MLVGWGRIKYVIDKVNELAPPEMQAGVAGLAPPPAWNDESQPLIDNYQEYRDTLEGLGIFFSEPLDLDFAMIKKFSVAYELDATDLVTPDESDIKSVLGKSYHGSNQYSEEDLKLFISYHKLFKVGSKPAAHINALSNLTDAELLADMPSSLSRLADAVIAKLAELPE